MSIKYDKRVNGDPLSFYSKYFNNMSPSDVNACCPQLISYVIENGLQEEVFGYKFDMKDIDGKSNVFGELGKKCVSVIGLDETVDSIDFSIDRIVYNPMAMEPQEFYTLHFQGKSLRYVRDKCPAFTEYVRRLGLSEVIFPNVSEINDGLRKKSNYGENNDKIDQVQKNRKLGLEEFISLLVVLENNSFVFLDDSYSSYYPKSDICDKFKYGKSEQTSDGGGSYRINRKTKKGFKGNGISKSFNT